MLGSMPLSHRAQHSGLLVMETVWQKQKFGILSFGDQHIRAFHRDGSELVFTACVKLN